MYQKTTNEFGSIITKIVDGLRISFPENPDNTDYQQYLAWLAEGNEPEVIDL